MQTNVALGLVKWLALNNLRMCDDTAADGNCGMADFPKAATNTADSVLASDQ